ncbi:Uracil-DNA glycosylase [Noviherbaspirillum humi]|uniref:Uracil-DNA glycosylase n=1 Tax=Noviherbaspirillum humi TaxID=1688639 RepID=A0A239DC72_9BURK|nr:uracil-DNA glycosylase [Noviherbaspirillum humi]SNS30006.1 Uracil-DNA glycosylase [Noviherbaspirillum humi]
MSPTSAAIPPSILDALQAADPSWHDCLHAGLQAMMQAEPAYLPQLAQSHFLPTRGRLFAAFSLPLSEVRYVLVGEGPYPREESATGVCFMDGAVEALWSEKGLSKPVNRATSLRNFMKMLMVADGMLRPEDTSGVAVEAVSARARAAGSGFIQTLTEMQANLLKRGFLLLNASLVYRPDVAPLKDAKAWQPLLQAVFEALAERGGKLPTLVLWGKIAEQLKSVPATNAFPKAVSEHPYNLSFIRHEQMQALFGPMHLLKA